MKIRVNDTAALSGELAKLDNCLFTVQRILEECIQQEMLLARDGWTEENRVGCCALMTSELNGDTPKRAYYDTCTLWRLADGWYMTQLERIQECWTVPISTEDEKKLKKC